MRVTRSPATAEVIVESGDDNATGHAPCPEISKRDAIALGLGAWQEHRATAVHDDEGMPAQ
jgi:hypothetical protein